MSRPLIILGTGPAGLAAAITLARAGREVLVYDHRPQVGRNYTGNLQMLTNYLGQTDSREGVLQLCEEKPPDLWPQRSATLYGPCSSPVIAQGSDPFGYLLRRGAGEGMLDSALFAAADAAGAQVRFDRTFEGRPDINATGARGVSGVAWEWHGHVDLADGFHARFDSRVTPGGFGYLLVANGNAVLGAAVTRSLGGIRDSFEGTAAFFQERYRLPEKLERSLSGRASVFLPRTGVDEHGTTYVGEAGGFSDLLFGFGIRQALETGVMAARAILERSDFDAKWKRGVEHWIEGGLAFRYLSETFGNAFYEPFVRLAGLVNFTELARRMYRPSAPARALARFGRQRWGNAAPGPHGSRCGWLKPGSTTTPPAAEQR